MTGSIVTCTKGGQTAASKDTKNKAEALQKRLFMLNRLAEGRIKYVGGIVIAANGIWYYNDNEEYAYQLGSTDGWKMMQDMFDVLMEADYFPRLSSVKEMGVEQND